MAPNVKDKIFVGAIHSVERAGNQLRLYKYCKRTLDRETLPTVTLNLQHIRGISVHDAVNEYVTTFHYNTETGRPLTDKIIWPYSYSDYSRRHFPDWREETDAQILSVLDMVKELK